MLLIFESILLLVFCSLTYLRSHRTGLYRVAGLPPLSTQAVGNSIFVFVHKSVSNVCEIQTKNKISRNSKKIYNSSTENGNCGFIMCL